MYYTKISLKKRFIDKIVLDNDYFEINDFRAHYKY